MKKVCTLLLALVFTACAFDSSTEGEKDKRNQRERDKLNQIYAGIRGTYVGSLRTATMELPIRMSLNTREAEVGKDSNGQPVFMPVLVARVVRPTLLLPDVRFSGQYIQSSGQLTLGAQNANQEQLSASGTLIRGVYDATVVQGSTPYGQLHVVLDPNIEPSDQREDIEEHERIRAGLELIAGTYNAVLCDKKFIDDWNKNHGTNYKSFPLSSFRIAVDESSQTALLAYVRVHDFTKTVMGAVAYYPELKNRFEFHAATGSAFPLDFSGNYEPLTEQGGKLTGTMSFALTVSPIIAINERIKDAKGNPAQPACP